MTSFQYVSTLKLSLMCIIFCAVLPGCVATPQKLLVILLDGFRWDYVEKTSLPNFRRIYQAGARAGYMRNAFPTLSYPNYYTLMTGLHSESHGMTGNYMYDPVTEESFLIGTNPEQYHAHWWDGGEPLWVTAVRQGKTAYMYYWPGCEVTIRGVDPTFCDAYTRVPTLDDFKFATGESLKLLSNNTANFAVVYHEQPDYVGHQFGPDSEQLSNTIQEIDAELGKLLDQLVQSEDYHEINVVIMSDHGMTPITLERTINLTSVLSDHDLFVTIMEAGAVASIYVSGEEQEDQVFSLLQAFNHPNMHVYRRNEIPERLYYKHGKYVGDITCLADLGWVIAHPTKPDFPKKQGQNMGGTHGYDNAEVDMRGIFYAVGPYFKAGSSVPFIHAVDPYNIMCDILDISPAPNNGTRDRLSPLLATSSARLSAPTPPHFVMFGFVMSIMLTCLWQ